MNNESINNSAATAEQFDRFAHFYDQDYRDYDADIALLDRLFLDNSPSILELGCGTGRVLSALVNRHPGCRFTGIDISPALLTIAHQKLVDQGCRKYVRLIEDDLCTFTLPTDDYKNNFNFAFCTSNTFMHLNEPELQLAALCNVYKHLHPGGRLFIDLFNPDIARLLAVNGICELADQWYDPQQNIEVIKWSVRTLDLAEQLQETLFIYEEIRADGTTRRTTCPFILRFLWRNEAVLMLERAGFLVEDVWGDFDRQPYGDGSERLLLLARKPES